MKNDGLDNVRGEKVMVPHWVRGEESLTMLSPLPQPLTVLGIGNSVGTSSNGITADAVTITISNTDASATADGKN